MTIGTMPALIGITPLASEQLRGIMANESGPDIGLRVWVQAGGGCGCSGGGVTYGMGIDDASTDDSVFSSEGVRLIVDPGSASLLGGAMIDFVDYGAQGRGFVIHTADEAKQAGGCGSGCGCGAH
jgi:iron-sulfur cluster assembly protein